MCGKVPAGGCDVEFVLSHPRRKNKDAPRAGHPGRALKCLKGPVPFDLENLQLDDEVLFGVGADGLDEILCLVQRLVCVVVDRAVLQ